ncbi:carbohydrate ABC transporter permease [Cohnella yongneupensis]|uniref:Carbohydrate ABC transporter permease n=1 Tax=Cohnella yongneupensis TaxID=425006 RepID=A0ABW0R793_9BACL
MRNQRAWQDIAFSGANYTLLAALGFFTLFPFWNLFSISLNDALDTLKGGIYFYPRHFTLTNYEIIFRNDSLVHATFISVARTVVGTALGVIATAMLAYSLSRKTFVMRKPFNIILVFTLFVNAGLLPSYLLIRDLGLMNHFAVYIVPALISAYNVIIVRSYFEQLPDGIVESATIDGANDYQVLFRIVMPVSMPVIATITLFIAVVHWNSWFDNYLYTSGTESLNTLQFELQKILLQSANELVASGNSLSSQQLRTNPETIRASMTMVVTLPILFVYPFLQRFFVKGIMFASMKE